MNKEKSADVMLAGHIPHSLMRPTQMFALQAKVCFGLQCDPHQQPNNMMDRRFSSLHVGQHCCSPVVFNAHHSVRLNANKQAKEKPNYEKNCMTHSLENTLFALLDRRKIRTQWLNIQTFSSCKRSLHLQS